jgi:hypothetical protein
MAWMFVREYISWEGVGTVSWDWSDGKDLELKEAEAKERSRRTGADELRIDDDEQVGGYWEIKSKRVQYGN